MGRVFLSYGTPLMTVYLFRYLVRMLSPSDNDGLAVEWNFRRVRGKWGRMANILGREGADRIMLGMFYVAVVQVVLPFGCETGVLNPG